MEYRAMIERTEDFDVAVAGGGTAGVFAAISAARRGARTVLIEKNARPGGTVTTAGVNFPGLFYAWGRQIISGPCWEAVKRTEARGGAVLPRFTYRPERHWHEQIRVNPFVYTQVLLEMCREAGVELRCTTMLADAWETGSDVQLLYCDKQGLGLIRAKAAVDATGDAVLCRLAGHALMKSEVQQPATLQNAITGYRWEDVSAPLLEEKLSEAALDPYVTPGRLLSWLKKGVLDVHISCVDADTSEGRTALESRAFDMLTDICDFLHTIPGLEGLQIAYAAAETGVRETNRIVGRTVITAQDYIEARHYDDSVCYAFYPIDLHVRDGIEQTFHRDGMVSRIPYGAMIPQESDFILCAGRCISSDRYANSAVRVEAVCMAEGQAAGCAAAIAAQEGLQVGAVDYGMLCSALRDIGAIVPEA